MTIVTVSYTHLDVYKRQALYPASCKPEDVFANTQQMQMSLYFYSDVLLRGEYPGYALHYFYDHDIHVMIKEEEEQLLKENTADFLSFSYYFTRITKAKDPTHPKENPYLEKSIWGWALDPLGFRNSLNSVSYTHLSSLVQCQQILAS